MRFTLVALFSISAAALLACGGSQPAPTPPAIEPPAAAPEPAPEADAGADASSEAPPAPAAEGSRFDDLSHEAKLAVMKTKVMPNLGKVFKEHDAKKFGKFGCASCHGPNKDKLADPHTVLPKLTLSNGGFEKLSKTKPAIMKFMEEKVVPEMAAALGEKPYDPATHQGFGCGGCHKVD